MRKSKKVVLEGLEPIEVKELTSAHFPDMLSLLKELMSLGRMEMAQAVDILLSHYEKIQGTLCSCLSIDEEQLKEIGGCDLVEIIEAWVEVNAGFFAKLKARLPADLQPMTTPMESSVN